MKSFLTLRQQLRQWGKTMEQSCMLSRISSGAPGGIGSDAAIEGNVVRSLPFRALG